MEPAGVDPPPGGVTRVKARLGGTIRRVGVPPPLAWTPFVTAVTDAFRVTPAALALTYEDDEGDAVTLSGDADLAGGGSGGGSDGGPAGPAGGLPPSAVSAAAARVTAALAEQGVSAHDAAAVAAGVAAVLSLPLLGWLARAVVARGGGRGRGCRRGRRHWRQPPPAWRFHSQWD